jgi:uncharacterized protein (TIGR03435 family)
MERFRLTFHRENKLLPSYSLIVAKSDPKLRSTARDVSSDDRKVDSQSARKGTSGFPGIPADLFQHPGIFRFGGANRIRLIVVQ